MKIKFTSNTNISLPENLSHIDLKYGFSYFYTKSLDEKSSLMIKVLSKIESLLNKEEQLNHNNQTVINHIAKVIDFLQSNLNQPFTENLNIQINTHNETNQKMKKFLRVFSPFSHKWQIAFDTELSCMNLNDNQVIIGSDSFSNDHFGNKISEHYGLGKAVEFILLHEVSHHLEHVNKNNFGTTMSKEFDFLYDKIKLLSNDDYNYEASKQTKNKEYKIPNTQLVQSLNLLRHEAYSDICSILLQRNMDIYNKSYDNETFNSYINKVGIERSENYLSYYSDGSLPLETICKFSHLTTTSILGIKNKIDLSESKEISLKDIHMIAEKLVAEGIYKTIHTVMAADIDLNKELKTLLSLDLKDNKVFISEKSKQLYQSQMKEMKTTAGKEWVDNFTNKVSLMDNVKDKTTHIFDIGMREYYFDNNIPNILLKDKLDKDSSKETNVNKILELRNLYNPNQKSISLKKN